MEEDLLTSTLKVHNVLIVGTRALKRKEKEIGMKKRKKYTKGERERHL